MSAVLPLRLQSISHSYGEMQALRHVTLDVAEREIFGLLGPNGGGKTTLFRIAATLLPVQAGSAHVFGHDVQTDAPAVRRTIGVTFQSPSLDGKLTVSENLTHQGHLYGLSGRTLRQRMAVLLDRLGLSARAGDRTDSLSGGLKRRVEIAKGLLHEPRLLLLDEPSTGLDPGARRDLWLYLQQLRGEVGVTVLVTTHLMEEAEHCDRLGILDRGTLVALGSPDELRASVGGDCLVLRSDAPQELAAKLTARFAVAPQQVGQQLRIEHARGHDLLREIVDAFPNDVTSVSLGKPTLEDVFIARTGHRFWDEGEQPAQPA